MSVANIYPYLAAIIEEGSFSRAAERLGISQPYLSQFISRQEKAYGAELIDRDTKPVSLTDAGRLVFESEGEVERLRENCAKRLAEVKAGTRGRVRLGVTNYREIFFLAEVLPAFRKRYPDVELVLVEGKTDELESFALSGKTDISLIAGPEHQPGLTAETVYCERILIAMNEEKARAFPESRSDAEYPPLSFARLDAEPFIVISEGQALHRLFERLCAVTGAQPRVVFETASPVAALSLASAGLGAALVPETVARRFRPGSPFRCFSFLPEVPDRPVYAVSREGAYLSRAAHALIDVMREVGRERFAHG